MIRAHSTVLSASPRCGVVEDHARLFRADLSASPMSSQAKHNTLSEARLFRADLLVFSYRNTMPPIIHVMLPLALQELLTDTSSVLSGPIEDP